MEALKLSFFDATQVMDIVPETQAIVEFQKEQVKYFLVKSWANMDDLANDEDCGIDYIPEKGFQLVTSRRRNINSKSNNNTRHKSSQSKASL